LTLLDVATNLGGAERFALALAAALPRDRFDPWVCATRSVTVEASDGLASAGVPQVCLGRKGKLDVHRLYGLVTLLKSGGFDVVHAHMFGSNAWGTVLGRLCGVPVVIAHEHNWSYAGSPSRRVIDRHVIARYATQFVTVCESARDRMIEVERIPPAKILVLPTAYIPHRVTAPVDIRAELGLPRRARIVAVAATLRREKALEVLIAAHARVVKSVVEAHLVILGDGACRQELEQLVAALDLAGCVHFLGPRHDVSAILATVDVGALSSDWEGMPLFALECMATETPLVATAVGGLPEIITHNHTGLLVPRRDPQALADAIVELLTDPDRGRQLAAAAAATIPDFRIDVVAARFADLYERLLVHRS